ncbi:hypothetical protein [Flavobacterium sp. 38-13]|uniref:hypothetical protein n=1 Tax=Flavobacterium sp. 38-13 TaxID=1896168 RepID=UPI000A59F389|nr:hypothetical protein [Flavobacterium sp. 38-13]
MKKTFTLILLFQSILSFSQVQTKTQKTIKILDPQSFYLNGGTRNMLGGNSRTGFKIDLPPNTVEWYYAFTTEPYKNNTQNLLLEYQLRSLLQTTGISGGLLSLIKIPTGQGLIDIYLTDKNGYDSFFEKDFFGTWKYISPGYTIEGSRKNAKDAKVKIDDLKTGSHFLVIRNTSATTGVNVKLEAVAIVEEVTTDLSTWDKKTKDLLFNNLRTDMKNAFYQYNDDKIDEITGCVVTKFTADLKPTDISTLAEYEIKAIIKKYLTECNL